jgi:TPR repeat protein
MTLGCAARRPPAGGPPPADAGLAALARSCDRGGAADCATLAYHYATGERVARDDARAAVLYERSCSGGSAQGCYNLGLHREKGRGVPVDLAGARVAYERG